MLGALIRMALNRSSGTNGGPRTRAGTAGPRAQPPSPMAASLDAITNRVDSQPPLDRAGKTDMLLVAGVRSVLALAGLFITWVVPLENERFALLTHISLIAYSLYSVWTVWVVSRSRARLSNRALTWVDVLFAGYLAALTERTNDIFFYFFFFAILSAAFTRGAREGMRVSVASAVLFTISGLAMSPFPTTELLDRTLVRPVCLLALGLLISHWGGTELELKQRLVLLREIGSVSNSRAGASRTIDTMLRRLCQFFGADSAILAVQGGGAAAGGTIYAASTSDSTRRELMQASEETIRLFMAVPQRAVTWPRKTVSERYVQLDTPSHMNEVRAKAPDVSALAHLIEAKFIALAGYRQGNGIEGRLVLARESRRFREADAMFLAHCSGALAAVVENVTLTEELIARTVEFERLNISRDLHDTMIQPYIGLRMAIEGAAREFRDDDRISARLAELIEMTEIGIQELRDYATRLRSGISGDSGPLASAIERQAARFARYYAMDVDVKIDPSLQLEGSVADAVFQMVAEGMSNVVRHTTARRARVAVWNNGDGCTLEISNPLADGVPGPAPFVPHSIAERAKDLGGRISVKPSRNGHTIVTVTVPHPLRSTLT